MGPLAKQVIREMGLLFLLKGAIIEANLLLAVVLWRVITVLGDALFYLHAYFCHKTPVFIQPSDSVETETLC